MIVEDMAYSCGQVSFLTLSPKVRQTYLHRCRQYWTTEGLQVLWQSLLLYKVCRKEKQNRMYSLCNRDRSQREKRGGRG